MKILIVGLIAVAVTLQAAKAQDREVITGTIYCDNNFTFYVNGEFVAQDPLPTIPHGAVNVSFEVESGRDITFAIDAKDWANTSTGLEYDNRCMGDGGLRAMFSNGVVTNAEWVCYTYNFGPVNWKDCFANQMVRNQSTNFIPQCKADENPMLEGCYARQREVPSGWTNPGFDDSHWEYATEFDEAFTGYGLPPPGCTVPGAYVSTDLDPNGDPIICPQNLDWGESSFIWRPALNLDNHILCRYTLQLGSSADAVMCSFAVLLVAVLAALQLSLY